MLPDEAGLSDALDNSVDDVRTELRLGDRRNGGAQERGQHGDNEQAHGLIASLFGLPMRRSQASGLRIRPRTLLRMRRIEFLDISLGGVAVAAGLRPGLRTRFPSSSLDEAYAFLDNMMDLYVRGTTTRLVQSFVPTRALQLGDIAYTYDSALVVIAFLQRATSDDLARATVLGDNFLYAQAHDPAGDGRIRNGYHVEPVPTQERDGPYRLRRR